MGLEIELTQYNLKQLMRGTLYIEAHLEESLTLDDVAKAACYSPYHFHRLFTSYMGESLYQYILITNKPPDILYSYSVNYFV